MSCPWWASLKGLVLPYTTWLRPYHHALFMVVCSQTRGLLRCLTVMFKNFCSWLFCFALVLLQSSRITFTARIECFILCWFWVAGSPRIEDLFCESLMLLQAVSVVVISRRMAGWFQFQHQRLAVALCAPALFGFFCVSIFRVSDTMSKLSKGQDLNESLCILVPPSVCQTVGGTAQINEQLI